MHVFYFIFVYFKLFPVFNMGLAHYSSELFTIIEPFAAVSY